MIKLGQLIKEAFELPPEYNLEAESLSQLIASMFSRKFLNAETRAISKKYWDNNATFFRIHNFGEHTNWGMSSFTITPKSGLYPQIILYVSYSRGAGSSQGYVTTNADAIYIRVNFNSFAKDFKAATEDLRETIKHELRHIRQLKLKIGLPKRKVTSRLFDPEGHTNDPKYKKTRQAHHLRDIEFKTNLHTYAYYIRKHLEKMFGNDRKPWPDEFRKVISGGYKSSAEKIGYFSNLISHMAKRDPERWKQFVLELWKLVFSSKKSVDQ